MPILINKTKIGQASRPHWAGSFKLPTEPSLQPAHYCPNVVLDERDVDPTDFVCAT